MGILDRFSDKIKQAKIEKTARLEKQRLIDEAPVKKGEGIMETVKLSGEIRLVLRDKNGKLKEDRIIKNVVTDLGKAALAGLVLVDVGGPAFDFIAIGIGTGGVTALNSESTTSGGARRGGADVVGTRVTTTTTNDTAQLVTTFTFTGSLALTEEGIFNAASAGTMLAYQSFAVLNVANGDTLAITHKIRVA